MYFGYYVYVQIQAEKKMKCDIKSPKANTPLTSDSNAQSTRHKVVLHIQN